MKPFKQRAGLGNSARNAASVMGALKLGQLAAMSEEEFEKSLRDLESGRLFQLLKLAGAVAVAEFPSARYAARRYAGSNLSLAAGDLPELVDGQGDLVKLIQGVGQENFERLFLRDAGLNDAARAAACGISAADAKRLRQFVDRAFIQSEFEARPAAPAAAVYSAVAGIKLKDGEPELAFFNREVWKGRYKVDQDKLVDLMGSMDLDERDRVEKVLKRVEFADRRKTTLYRALEILLGVQAEYLRTGDPALRRPLSQKTLARNLEVDASVLNRLVSNKSLEMPWGVEVPMGALLPTPKRVNIDRLAELAAEKPGASDEALRAELKARCGIQLSRRSVAQYRKDIGLAASGRRGDKE